LTEEEAIDASLNFVARYAADVSDWITIKKELLKSLPPQCRKRFSTRDPITKKQSMNDFEISLAKKWESITGKKLILNGHEQF
jgi:hypothetical protein